MKHQFNHILGQSDGLKYVFYRAEQVAPHNTTVLILGETGTGKELVAALIHSLSPRKDRPLITVNCAALPANLIESELFGREKGAFTGANTRQVGRFEVAHGSTLCLDEIGELPLELQAKLLRAVQQNEFERLGSSQTIKVDVRIVATTNRNLDEEVRQGRFRQDLYYRLNVFPITVPPLRQRKEDIPILVQAFTERYARKLGKPITSIQKETMKALQDYPWPGNIRELESIIERAVILCPGPVLQLADKLEIPSFPSSVGMNTLEEVERYQILKILSETRWRIEGNDGAATILGLHPSTLRARMQKRGITRPETKESVKVVQQTLKFPLSICRFHKILRSEKQFHPSLLFSPVDRMNRRLFQGTIPEVGVPRVFWGIGIGGRGGRQRISRAVSVCPVRGGRLHLQVLYISMCLN